MTDETNYIGNTSTIIKFISSTIAGYSVAYFVSKGINLPIDSATLAEWIGIIIGLIIAYIDAKYPNTFGFLGNNKQTQQKMVLKEIVLNEEYENSETDEEEETCENEGEDGC